MKWEDLETALKELGEHLEGQNQTIKKNQKQMLEEIHTEIEISKKRMRTLEKWDFILFFFMGIFLGMFFTWSILN